MHTSLYLITLIRYRTFCHPGKSSFAILVSPPQRQKVLILIMTDWFWPLQDFIQSSSVFSCVWLLLSIFGDSSMWLWESITSFFVLFCCWGQFYWSCLFVSIGSSSTDSTKHTLKIFGKKSCVVADMYYAVRHMMVASVLTMYRLLLFYCIIIS